MLRVGSALPDKLLQSVVFRFKLHAALKEEPEQTLRELRQWLGSQAPSPKVSLVEVITGKAPLSKCSEEVRDGASVRVGLNWGHDLRRARDRRMLLILIGPALRERILRQRAEDTIFLKLFEQLWHGLRAWLTSLALSTPRPAIVAVAVFCSAGAISETPPLVPS